MTSNRSNSRLLPVWLTAAIIGTMLAVVLADMTWLMAHPRATRAAVR